MKYLISEHVIWEIKVRAKRNRIKKTEKNLGNEQACLRSIVNTFYVTRNLREEKKEIKKIVWKINKITFILNIALINSPPLQKIKTSKFLYNNSPVGRVFSNDPGDLGSIPGCVIPKTLKMVLDTSLFNTQQYKVRIEGKVEQSRERSSALPYIPV